MVNYLAYIFIMIVSIYMTCSHAINIYEQHTRDKYIYIGDMFMLLSWSFIFGLSTYTIISL